MTPLLPPPTAEERAVILHALGLTPKGRNGRPGRRWAYRNYFASGEADRHVWEGLVAKGYASACHASSGAGHYHWYAVTRAGITASNLGAYIPREIWGKHP